MLFYAEYKIAYFQGLAPYIILGPQIKRCHCRAELRRTVFTDCRKLKCWSRGYLQWHKVHIKFRSIG
jgi:hypothetical protein